MDKVRRKKMEDCVILTLIMSCSLFCPHMTIWQCRPWFGYILITNLMYWLLFIYKIIFSSTCFERQVLIFRRIQLCTCSIWYCHSLWEFVVACRYTAWVRTDSVLTQAVYRKATTNSYREWRYHMLHVHNCILLKMSTWGLKHVEENIIL